MVSQEWRKGLSNAMSRLSDATCAVGNLEESAPDEHADAVGEAIARAAMAIARAQELLREVDNQIRSLVTT